MTKECMEAKGWKYWPRPPVTLPASAASSDGDLTHDEGYVRQHGYGITLSPAPAGEDLPDPNASYLDTLTEQERRQYGRDWLGTTEDFETGSPSGCANEARQEVFGSLSETEVTGGQELVNELDDRVRADPRIVEATQEWSRCMTGHGYDLSTPQQARAHVQERAEQQAISPDEERQIALADLDCYDRELRDVTEAVRREHEERILQENPQIAAVLAEVARELEDLQNDHDR
ncbi:MAG: hypothetical protein M5U14_19065 [Acidimicrobiia bacterium]|nr:hypothetical protein [Acidimicrobiia bacterium]